MNLRKIQRDRKFELLPRDIEIVKLLSKGMTAKEIGEWGAISKRTVETIVHSLLKEYKCENTPHLVSTFIRKKIIK